MKLHIHYKIDEGPWGGGNSFLRSFRNYCLNNSAVKLVNGANAPSDIVLFNACNFAKGQMLSVDELLNLKFVGRSGFWGKFHRNSHPKLLVYRSDGFRSRYAGAANTYGDNIQRCCLQIADWVIFQNKYTLQLARSADIGYLRENYSVIYNGVDQQLFQCQEGAGWDGKRSLRMLMVNWSSNLNKGYREAVAFAEFPGIDFTFVGNWPKSVPTGNVRVLPAMSHPRLAAEISKHDVFFHPSKFDSCPNVCLEALSCGLPIVYHRTGGVGEIAADCGWEFDDEHPDNTLTLIRSDYFARRAKVMSRRADFSMERCGNEYLDCFNKLLDRRVVPNGH